MGTRSTVSFMKSHTGATRAWKSSEFSAIEAVQRIQSVLV